MAKQHNIYVYLSEDDNQWLLHVDIDGKRAITTEHKSKDDAVLMARLFYNENELSPEIQAHKKGN